MATFCIKHIENRKLNIVPPGPKQILLQVNVLSYSDVVSVRCFGVRVSVMFHFMSFHYTLISVWFAEWPPFGK